MTDYAAQIICFAFGMLVIVFLWALMSAGARAEREDDAQVREDLPAPWHNYDGWPAPMIIGALRNMTDTGRLYRAHAYELDHRARLEILTAITARLAELADLDPDLVG